VSRTVRAGDTGVRVLGTARPVGVLKITRGTGMWHGATGQLRRSSGPAAGGGLEGEYRGTLFLP
jgi:hypothetical protein